MCEPGRPLARPRNPTEPHGLEIDTAHTPPDKEAAVATTSQQQLSAISQQLNTLTIEVKQMALDLTALTAAVNQEVTVEKSAVVLIQALAAEVANNAGDPAAVQALAAQITASANALAMAVASSNGAPVPLGPSNTVSNT